MRTYTQEEKQAVIDRVISGELSTHIPPTPAYPRVHFTVGYELTARNRKPITEGQSVSAIFICLKTKSHVWRALLKFLNLRPAHPRHL